VTTTDQPTERTTKFSFVGVKYESLVGDFERGQEVEFTVKGHVKGIGEEDFSQGPMSIVKVAVDSVVPVSFEEPTPPREPDLFDDEDGDEEGPQ
jgi:hypothetical protein